MFKRLPKCSMSLFDFQERYDFEGKCREFFLRLRYFAEISGEGNGKTEKPTEKVITIIVFGYCLEQKSVL